MKSSTFLLFSLLLILAGCGPRVQVKPQSSDPRLSQAADLEAQGRFVEAFKAYQELASAGPPVPPETATDANLACNRLVQQVLDIQGLNEIEPLLKPGAQEMVAYRRLELWAQAGQLDAFETALADFTLKFPQSPRLAEAQDLARQLYRKTPVEARGLGLLVPLTGPSAAFGQDVRRGVELALESANAGLPAERRFHLTVADEGDNAVQALSATARLIDQDKVVAILGPVLSRAAQAVGPYCLSRRVPLFSPTAAQAGLTDGNAFFFRNCMTAEGQAGLMAGYALTDLKVTRCASLYPGTPYGMALAQAFARHVSETGGVMVAQVSYTAGTVDFKSQLVDLGGTNPGILKEDEARTRIELQSAVELASSTFGDFFLRYQQAHPAPAPPAAPAVPAGTKAAATPTPGPSLTVAVVDFACDSPSAAFRSARGLSDRFFRTLGHLQDRGIAVVSPGQSESWLAQHPDQARGLTAEGAASLGKMLGVPLIVTGWVSEYDPDRKGFQVFRVKAQVVDTATGEVASTRQFEFSKLKPVNSNAGSLQALYLPCDSRDLSLIAPNLAFYDLKVQLLGPESWYRPELLREADDLEGALFTTGFFADSADAAVQSFSRAYKEKFAALPDALAAQAFDACGILVKALESAANREDLRDALENLKDFPGVTGRTSFGGSHDAVKNLPVIRVHQGQFVQVR